MSLKATLWAYDNAPVKNPAAVLVLVGLADEAGDDGTGACPYIDKLKHRARISERSVQSYLKDLYRARLIDLGDQAVALRRYNKRPGHAPRVWNLNLDATWESVPKPRSSEEMEAYAQAFRKKTKSDVDLADDSGVQDSHPIENANVTDNADRPGVQTPAPQIQCGVQDGAPRGAIHRTPGVQPTAPFPLVPEEHPATTKTPPAFGSAAVDESSNGVQPTLTGEVHAPPSALPRDVAFGIARKHLADLATSGAPAPDSDLVKLQSGLVKYLKTGYSEAEIAEALHRLGDPVPHSPAMYRVLRAIRQGRSGTGQRPTGAPSRSLDTDAPWVGAPGYAAEKSKVGAAW